MDNDIYDLIENQIKEKVTKVKSGINGQGKTEYVPVDYYKIALRAIFGNKFLVEIKDSKILTGCTIVKKDSPYKNNISVHILARVTVWTKDDKSDLRFVEGFGGSDLFGKNSESNSYKMAESYAIKSCCSFLGIFGPKDGEEDLMKKEKFYEMVKNSRKRIFDEERQGKILLIKKSQRFSKDRYEKLLESEGLSKRKFIDSLSNDELDKIIEKNKIK